MSELQEEGVKTRRNVKIVAVMLLCFSLSFVWAIAIRKGPQGKFVNQDFSQIYYGARCVVRHEDPYVRQDVIREIQEDGGNASQEALGEAAGHSFDWLEVYPPTALFVALPFVALPAAVAGTVWFSAVAAALVCGGLLIWDLGKGAAPILAGVLTGIVLANSSVLLAIANPAGLAIGMCAIAAWCFLRERRAWAGVLLMAVSLMLKPHDGGFVWLYFVLAGGTLRKRAVQTLAIAAVLVIGSAVWIAPASPHWFQEFRSNLTQAAAHGSDEDPGPAGYNNRSLIPEISLQNTISIFRDDPRLYNPATYLVIGSLILAWAITTLRKRSTPDGALFALAAISAPALLLVYHRSTDAKLLLLTIPACAMLWKDERPRRWIALGLTSAAIFVTSDIPLIFFSKAAEGLTNPTFSLSGKLSLLLVQPAPVVLLAAGCFYLWVYVGYKPSQAGHTERDVAVSKPAEPTAT